MENQSSFLEKWKQAIHKLKDEGLVTEEEIQDGFDIPIRWLCSSGMTSKEFIGTLQELYKIKNWRHNNYADARPYIELRYFERCGKPVLDIYRDRGFVCITDKEEFPKDVVTEKFLEEILSLRKRIKTKHISADWNLPFSQAKEIVDHIYDKKQTERELYATNHFLGEMAENFGEYYKYMQEEKKISEELREKQKMDGKPIETMGGLIEPVSDIVGPKTGGGNIPKPERVSEISDFRERDSFLRALNPERIIKFASQDKKTGELIEGAYTCYIYKNPQQNEGYLVVSEPLQGDKETQTFYASKQYVEEMMFGEEDIEKFWGEFVRIYIEEMSRTEFSAEENTYTFRHTADLETYKRKIEGVVKGPEKNPETPNAQKASRMARMASGKLYGKCKYKEDIINCGVTRSGYEEAKATVFTPRETDKTNEKGDVTHE